MLLYIPKINFRIYMTTQKNMKLEGIGEKNNYDRVRSEKEKKRKVRKTC